MKAISLKLPEDVLRIADRCARAMAVSRGEYIRRAIDKMNREAEARNGAESMVRASRKVRKESMRINAEFAAAEDDVDDDLAAADLQTPG